MRSTFHGLEAMKRALYTQQTALNTVSHNVANANTEGYSRQVVDMSAFHPLQYPAMSRGTEAGQLGQGSWVDSIRRMRDQYLDRQYRNESSLMGQWEVKRENLDKIDAILNEPSDTSLSTVINEFFKSWHDLSESPDSVSAKKVVRQTAISLVETFQHVAARLNTLDNDINLSITSKASEVNSLISEINDLNGKIKTLEMLGDNANDLRDQRDLLVDKIAEMIDVSVTDGPDGYTLKTTAPAPNTVTLLDSTTGTMSPLDPSTISVATFSIGGTQVTSGELRGMLESKKSIGDYLTQLDTLANGIINSVNGVHPSFFIGTGAATMDLDPTIKASETNIQSGTSGNAGDNSIALQVAGLINSKIFDSNSDGTVDTTFEDFFQSMISQLGVEQRHAEYMEQNQGAIVTQISNQRHSISDVSIDEEMANMIKFQHAYNAAARVITTIDSILDRIINGMGLTR
ncbi:flagellar hook-associated protein FlgK [Effusibacillus lacus]|uniref:Flagellar hook-associated protein 1 n=1 Tax=Effusibacillus lacus TaxID=1348429 RepID=A0A292YK80_9BACL|nr:flagellar hook-associated protein FlgK [Effusibacillus lacus]TCS69813.1 flagellar hook-associated protein 1 FlgK [Effusibacillus lacus]GAX88895.1 flagellar hook-associated protein FlgK [Effusibacillus lacus]